MMTVEDNTTKNSVVGHKKGHKINVCRVSGHFRIFANKATHQQPNRYIIKISTFPPFNYLTAKVQEVPVIAAKNELSHL